MTKATKPRRIRIGYCPRCGYVFKWKRLRAIDGIRIDIQQCPQCYSCCDGSMATSELVDPADYPNIK